MKPFSRHGRIHLYGLSAVFEFGVPEKEYDYAKEKKEIIHDADAAVNRHDAAVNCDADCNCDGIRYTEREPDQPDEIQTGCGL